MTNAVERLVNLALFFGKASGAAVTAEQVRTEVAGYPAEQDTAAFLRMFERDKEELRSWGLSITSDPDGSYRLDTESTFAAEVSFAPAEVAALTAVGSAMLQDPAFPFAEDLRFALAKLSSELPGCDSPVTARTADERPEDQGVAVAELDRAARLRKRAEFDYTNSRGEQKRHTVEPFGLFVRDGRWYLVARDIELGTERVYALARLTRLSVNTARPKSPDYDVHEGFDLSSFVGLPFQYGPGPSFEAVIGYEPEHAWRAEGLSAGKGRIDRLDGGKARWHVDARDEGRLLRWVMENGPGVYVVEPKTAHERLRHGLTRVADSHERGGDDA